MKQIIFSAVLLVLAIFSNNTLSAQTWNLTGNTPTATQFLGTTNLSHLNVRTNNIPRLRVSAIDGNNRSSLLIGSTTGYWDTDPNRASINLAVDIQNNTATTYGHNSGLRAFTRANGTNAIGTSEGHLATSASWAAAGTMYGSVGRINISRLTANSSAAHAMGGNFYATLTGATLTGTGNNRVVVAGVGGFLTGTITSNTPAGTPTGGGNVLTAVYGNDLINTNATWAAYFAGKTYCSSGTWTSSDRRFKTDIKQLNGALNTIQQLKGVRYGFDREKFAERNFEAGQTTGFIAQELREVLPELVNEDNSGYLSIRYEGVIPVLAEAVKELKSEKDNEVNELQAQLAEKTQKITDLEARLSRLEKMMAAAADRQIEAPKASMSTLQLSPNPFAQSTQVACEIPASAIKAEVIVTDFNGKMIQNITVAERGQCQVQVNLSGRPNGFYTATLMVDGKVTATSKMALAAE